MLYVCLTQGCIRVPHANHVVMIRGVTTCSWCLQPLAPLADDMPADITTEEELPVDLDRLSL